MSENTVASITGLAEPLAASLGLSIWGLELAFGGKSLLRLYVEGENGVDIDKCAELSRLLSLSLDVEDTIPDAYVLEVSSPGLERTFFTPEQLAAYVGSTVEVSLLSPASSHPGRKNFLGTLTGAANGEFSLMPLDAKEGTEPVIFCWADVKKAKRIHFLPETDKAKKGGKKPPKTPKATQPRTSDAEGAA